MKNLIIYSGIALVVFANIDNTSFEVKSGVGASQESKKEVLAGKGFKSEVSNEYISNSKKITTIKKTTAFISKTFILRHFPKTKVNKTIGGEEPIEEVSVNKMNKTAEELIAEDNLITENNISNDTYALDFDLINSISLDYEVVEPITIYKKEKTADQLIAEDNAITENNISNETQALDFEIINEISKPRNHSKF